MKSTDPFRAQLTVSNLGANEHAELTIRPLTLFFGPNGTNKTWSAYALYGLLPRYHRGSRPRGDVPAGWSELVQPVAASLRAAAGADGHAREAYVSLLWPDDGGRLDGDELCRLHAIDANTLAASEAILRVRHPPGERDTIDLRLQIDGRTERRGVFQTSSGPSHFDPTIHLAAKPSEQHFLATFRARYNGVTGAVRAFPAERKALLTLHHQLSTLSTVGPLVDAAISGGLGSSIAASRLKDAAASMERSLPRSLSDFITEVDRAWHRRPDAGPGPMADLAETLEGLRESAMPGDFVFIDAPETNAHPEAQLAIAELIALMVDAGLRVVATAHSPYIIDHLHNLIEAERLDPPAQARFAERLEPKTFDAFSSGDQVAAYHFGRDGVVSDAFDREDRVFDWSLLGDDADDIANLYSELLGARSTPRRPSSSAVASTSRCFSG